jgi:hypothetical protein
MPARLIPPDITTLSDDRMNGCGAGRRKSLRQHQGGTDNDKGHADSCTTSHENPLHDMTFPR